MGRKYQNSKFIKQLAEPFQSYSRQNLSLISVGQIKSTEYLDSTKKVIISPRDLKRECRRVKSKIKRNKKIILTVKMVPKLTN